MDVTTFLHNFWVRKKGKQQQHTTLLFFKT